MNASQSALWAFAGLVNGMPAADQVTNSTAIIAVLTAIYQTGIVTPPVAPAVKKP